jgi:transposase-like protein
VKDAPYTSDLDLASVTTQEELVDLLKKVHLRADAPSLRMLERKTRLDPRPLSKTTVSEVLRGVRRPSKAVMVAFLQACGVPDDQVEPWRRAWDKIYASRPGSAETSNTEELQEEISRLHAENGQLQAENGRLRLELAEIDRRSMWRFPDNFPITLVSYRLPSDLRPRHADPDYPDYIRISSLADLDTLIDIHGEIKKYNPASEVIIRAAQDLTWREVESHLVLIGGLTWKTVIPWFSQKLPIPIQAEDPADRGAIVVRNPDGGEHEFKSRLIGEGYFEDVGFFVRGKNPVEPLLTLTICGGITTRGVQGAAQCFIDPEMRDRNEQYLVSRFSGAPTYCVVMRVSVIHQDIRIPDLSEEDDRFFEWCDARPGIPLKAPPLDA